MRPRFPMLTMLVAAVGLSATCVTTKRPAPIAIEQSPRPAKFELTYWTEPREVRLGCIGDTMPLPTVPSVDTVMEVVHQESGRVWRCPHVAPAEWPNISFLPQCESSSAWQNGAGNYTVRVLPNERSDEPEAECNFRYDDPSIGRITIHMAAPLDAGDAMCRIRRSRPAPDAVRILPDAVEVSPFGELAFPTFALANGSPSALYSAHRCGGFSGDVELMDRDGWRRVVVLSPASSSDDDDTVPSGATRRSVVDTRSSKGKGPGVVAGTYRYSVSFVDRALPPDRLGSWTDDAFEAAVVFQWPPAE